MAPIAKGIPADFQEKQERQQAPNGTDRTSSGACPGAAGLRGSVAPAGDVRTGDRISPAAEEHHRSPQPGKGISPAWQDPPGNGKSECSLLP
ncbi:hypothetical protein [Chryseobacterium gregarium]|uniref:hypothetical protein n=1 Tax=Chryseobacterium gregarium TaxID=456299 RepID=UPI000403AFBE|nr:hypothetical protein [Chryseobacterium gregarium]